MLKDLQSFENFASLKKYVVSKNNYFLAVFIFLNFLIYFFNKNYKKNLPCQCLRGRLWIASQKMLYYFVLFCNLLF